MGCDLIWARNARTYTHTAVPSGKTNLHSIRNSRHIHKARVSRVSESVQTGPDLSLTLRSLSSSISPLSSQRRLSLSRCTVHLHGTLGVAPTMCPLPLPLPLPPPQPGPRRTWQGGGRDEYRPAHYSLKRSKTKQALVPPKPNELDMHRFTLRRYDRA